MFAQKTIPALRAARLQANRSIRAYSTPAPAGNDGSNKTGLFLGIAGVVGLGAWAYMNQTQKPRTGLEAYKLDYDGKTSTNPYLDGNTWKNVKLSKITPHASNAHIYQFDYLGDDAGQKDSGLTIASCLMVQAGEGKLLDDKGKPVIRPYTPISPPSKKGSIDIMVKTYPTGKMGPYLETLKQGDEIQIKGPFLKYEYKPSDLNSALFIAGGSGITPAFQLISHAMAIPGDTTKFTLLFANVEEKDILLRDQWDDLAAKNPNRLKVVYFLDKPPQGWKGEEGYISAATVNKYFPRDGSKQEVFICGPPPQVAALAGAKKGREQGELAGVLKELGYKQDQVFKF